MSSSHVSVCGKFSIDCLCFARQFQIPAASFVGIKSRKVVIVDASSDFAARYRTVGNSCEAQTDLEETSPR